MTSSGPKTGVWRHQATNKDQNTKGALPNQIPGCSTMLKYFLKFKVKTDDLDFSPLFYPRYPTRAKNFIGVCTYTLAPPSWCIFLKFKVKTDDLDFSPLFLIQETKLALKTSFLSAFTLRVWSGKVQGQTWWPQIYRDPLMWSCNLWPQSISNWPKQVSESQKQGRFTLWRTGATTRSIQNVKALVLSCPAKKIWSQSDHPLQFCGQLKVTKSNLWKGGGGPWKGAGCNFLPLPGVWDSSRYHHWNQRGWLRQSGPGFISGVTDHLLFWFLVLAWWCHTIFLYRVGSGWTFEWKW